jgi:hypothetical protein
VDGLQQVIKRFSREGILGHPIVSDQTRPVIQSANDTFILIQGCPDQACILKEILDSFSATRQLSINYTKSTFVPINTDEEEQLHISHILGCSIASFPQTYLGIPISDSKLPRWALYPLLQSIDNSVDTLSINGLLLEVGSH